MFEKMPDQPKSGQPREIYPAVINRPESHDGPNRETAVGRNFIYADYLSKDTYLIATFQLTGFDILFPCQVLKVCGHPAQSMTGNVLIILPVKHHIGIIRMVCSGTSCCHGQGHHIVTETEFIGPCCQPALPC